MRYLLEEVGIDISCEIIGEGEETLARKELTGKDT